MFSFVENIRENVRVVITRPGVYLFPGFPKGRNTQSEHIAGMLISLTDLGEKGVCAALWDPKETRMSWDRKIYPVRWGTLDPEHPMVKLGRGIKAWFLH